ncbi:unnamed protein product [Caenorhabditis brenneri]
MGSATWKCPSDPPNYYLPVLHFIGFISIPINFSSLYLVWFHTPKESKFRYCLLYVQIVAFLVEVDMSWICPGYYLFPMMAGYNMAITNRVFPAHQTAVFGAFKICFELPSLLMCFIYRQDSAADLDNKYKLRKSLRNFVIATCHTFPFVIAFCLFMSELSKEEMEKILKKDWPNCLHVLNHQGFVMYDPSGNLWSAAIGFFSMAYISGFSLFGAYLGLHTMYILQKVRVHLSPQTYTIHMSAMIHLGLQCVVPTIFVIIPFNFIFLVVYNDWWELQELATNSLFVMASHSMTSSLVMILSNQRFRQLFLERVFRISSKFTSPVESRHVAYTTTRIGPTGTVIAPV